MISLFRLGINDLIIEETSVCLAFALTPTRRLFLIAFSKFQDRMIATYLVA